MATSAQYASTPVVGSATLTTADTSLTAPTTVASLVNLFIYDGTNYILWQQVPVVAITSSTTTPAFNAVLSSNVNANVMPLTLPTGYSLRATTSVTQTGVRVTAYGGNF